jgi:TonB family protein
MGSMRAGIGIAVFLFASPLLAAQQSAVQGTDAPVADSVASDYDAPPKLVKQKKPKYPDAAFRKGLEGTVKLEFIVELDGKAGSVRVLESVPGLDAAAVECLRSWRFEPATRQGLPVRVVAQAPISFCIYRNCAPKP